MYGVEEAPCRKWAFLMTYGLPVLASHGCPGAIGKSGIISPLQLAKMVDSVGMYEWFGLSR